MGLPRPGAIQQGDASGSGENATQRLLACAVLECDAKLDIEKHCQLLRQVDITELFAVSRLDSAVRKELSSDAKLGSFVSLLPRDYTALSGELGAFFGSTGPYTLHEIYSCFSFCDKLAAVKLRADQVLFATVRSPGSGLVFRMPEQDRRGLSDCWARRFPEPDYAEMGTEDFARQSREWWSPPAAARLERLVRAGADLISGDPGGQTGLHVLCESALSDVRFAANNHIARQAEARVEAADALAIADAPSEGAPSVAANADGCGVLATTDGDAPSGAAASGAAVAGEDGGGAAEATAVEARASTDAPSRAAASEAAAAGEEGAGVHATAAEAHAGGDAPSAAAASTAVAAASEEGGGTRAIGAGAHADGDAPSAEASAADVREKGAVSSADIALAQLKGEVPNEEALQELLKAFTVEQAQDSYSAFRENLRLLGADHGEEAAAVDARYASLVEWYCREAPMAMLMPDLYGRTPFCILTDSTGTGCQAASGDHLVPLRTLLALCDGLERCFSLYPTNLLAVMRTIPSFVDAVEGTAFALRGAGQPLPQPLLRALDWIEVVMGGAWELAQEEPRVSQHALFEGTCPDVEDLMNSAIRLNRICEQLEEKMTEWRAEEVALKLCEFKNRVNQKARQYEDRIARLESEIQQHTSLGNVGGLEEPSLTSLAVAPSKDAAAAATADDSKKDSSGAATGDAVAPADEAKTAKPPDEPKNAATPDAAERKPSAAPCDPTAASDPANAPESTEEAAQVVMSIRQKRLVDCDLSGATEEVKKGLGAMRRSLCAAVERLATDLYADQCHCFWELIQNADDNKYAESTTLPALDILLCQDAEHGAYVMTVNNEIGLRTCDVHAICDVNASLKGIGQTGHKGIGWKSVFRVSDCPHVLSRHFSFKFHVNGPLGKLAFVTPTALTDAEHTALPEAVRSAQDAGCTVMYLPLRCEGDAAAVQAELRQIAQQNLCLLFLRRLQRITLGFPDGTRTRLERQKASYATMYFPNSPTAAVKITGIGEDGSELRRCTQEFVMHNHQVSLPSGESLGELTLAFPAQSVTEEAEEVPLQHLFTFLPVRILGFRFAIQGPFDLTADRSNLHGKSARNRALCTAVPKAFASALLAVPELRAHALALFGQETPEAMWLTIRGQMLEALRDVECIPTEPGGKLAPPSECLLAPEAARSAEAAQELPHEVLWACCRRRIVRADWAAKFRVQLQRMKVTELGWEHWLKVLRGAPAVAEDSEDGKAAPAMKGLLHQAVEKGDVGVFRRIFALLGDVLTEKPEVLDELRDLQLLPGLGRKVLRLADGPVCAGFAPDLEERWQISLDRVGAIRVLDPAAVAVLDARGQKFLEVAGITKPAASEILPLAAEWHMLLSQKAAMRWEAARAVRLAEAEAKEARRRAEEEEREETKKERDPDGCGPCSGVDDPLAASNEPASSSSPVSTGPLPEQPSSSSITTAVSAQWDRELLIGSDVGPLGLRFTAATSVVLEVDPGSWAESQGLEPGDEITAFGGTPVATMDRQHLRRALAQRPLTIFVRPRRYAQHRKADLRLEWPEEMVAPEDAAKATEAKRTAAAEAAAKEEARRQRPRGFWDAGAEAARKRVAAARAAAGDQAKKGQAAEEEAGAGAAAVEQAPTAEDGAAEAGPEEGIAAATAPSVPMPPVPEAYPAVNLVATVDAVWASLACMRRHCFKGDAGVLVPSCGRELSWKDLGAAGLLVPTVNSRSSFGPVRLLTSPTYLGEMAEGQLTPDVVHIILAFIGGTVAKNGGVLADVPPAVIGLPTELAVVEHSAGAASEESSKKAGDLLEWEAFFDQLGMKQLSPTRRQQVAGTVLTITLGLRLSSSSWWSHAEQCKQAFAYVRARLEAADRVEIAWLRSLRARGGVDVSQLFLRGPFLRYGGSFLPYLQLYDPSAEMQSCLHRLGIATSISGKALRECLRVLSQSGECFDAGVYADIYAALSGLPENEQELSATGDFGRRLDPFEVFTPPRAFRKATECIWASGSDDALCWLVGFVELQPIYFRYGERCKTWLLGPHCRVPLNLHDKGIGYQRFLAAIHRLIQWADTARRVPSHALHDRLDGPNSPTASAFLGDIQNIAVQAYRHLAERCDESVPSEARETAIETLTMVFNQQALIIIANEEEWSRPRRVTADEAFWDVADDLKGTKAEKLALKYRYDPKDHEVLKKFFVDILGVTEKLTHTAIEAMLRVPLAEESRAEELSAFQSGFALNDFEEVRQVVAGPPVLDDSSLFQELPPEEHQAAYDAGVEPMYLPSDGAYPADVGEPFDPDDIPPDAHVTWGGRAAEAPTAGQQEPERFAGRVVDFEAADGGAPVGAGTSAEPAMRPDHLEHPRHSYGGDSPRSAGGASADGWRPPPEESSADEMPPLNGAGGAGGGSTSQEQAPDGEAATPEAPFGSNGPTGPVPEESSAGAAASASGSSGTPGPGGGGGDARAAPGDPGSTNGISSGGAAASSSRGDTGGAREGRPRRGGHGNRAGRGRLEGRFQELLREIHQAEDSLLGWEQELEGIRRQVNSAKDRRDTLALEYQAMLMITDGASSSHL